MKVLFIITAYPRHSGEVITPWLTHTIRRLGDRGVEVEVLAPAYRGLKTQLVDGVRVHRFRYAPSGWETLTHDQTAPDRIREKPAYLGLVPSYVAAGSLAAIRLARTGEFDVLHAFWPIPHGLIGLAASRASGVPLVSTFFGVELSWLERQMRVLRPVARQIIRSPDAVTVISEHTAAAVRRIAGDVELHRIPFGATVVVADSHSNRDSLKGSFDILFVGRLVERKGVRILIDAVARLQDRGVRLTIVGDGPERSALEAAAGASGAAGAIEFKGFVSAANLHDYLAATDTLVLPALRDAKGDVEGLGVVLLEALALGKPVIASDSGGIRDIVQHEKTGLLVPPGDAEALARAIARYVENPEYARDLALAGREHTAREFSWDSITGRLRAIYRSVERSSPPAS